MPLSLDSLRSHAQHRNAFYLLVNTAAGAATGLLFWVLFVRILGLPPHEVGLGYAAIALGTAIAVVAKGGLDTALIRHAPQASRADATRLLGLAVTLAIGSCIALCILAAVGSLAWTPLPDLPVMGWVLAGTVASLLAVSWLQDAYFMAEGDARLCLHRNLVMSALRLLLPVPIVLLGLWQPVALAWAVALGGSILVAALFMRRLPDRAGARVERRGFLRSALRNLSGGAAEFLPGLLLVPIVLAAQGPAAAAYFGMAWTAASMLFLACGAVSRSALAELVRGRDTARTLRRAAAQHLWIVVPGAVIGALAAKPILAVFGPDYAVAAGPALAILFASALLVAPGTLYLALARSRESPWALAVVPAILLAALLVLAPILGRRFGLTGVAAAWAVANTPMAVAGAWTFRRETSARVRSAQHAPHTEQVPRAQQPPHARPAPHEEVNHARPVDRPAHLE